MLSMTYGLLGMTVIIGVLGVVNTLATSVFKRRREIGLLRAFSLGARGVMRNGVPGIGVGLAVRHRLGYRHQSLPGLDLRQSLARSSLPTYETELPWARLGLYLLLALVVGVLAAVWPR
ncbi:hypothetical protein ACFVUY_27405 [Kitasatospora sp. NPDC058063]|uniref:hypothetical protein n=1 Tax=unclassified Kitasatospora TaxID=2633591 RepID=UPI0036DE2544